MNEKVLNGLYGFVIGDAMGVPVEFISRDNLDRYPLISMKGYGTHNQPKGTWSDDTAMTLATIDAIIEKRNVDIVKIAENFVDWRNKGKYMQDDYCFDIGRTTTLALTSYERNRGKIKPEQCGLNSYYDNGNGSLMRMYPIACWCYCKNLSMEEELELITNVSSITHSHEISIIACYIYVEFLKKLFSGMEKHEAYHQLKNIDLSKYNMGVVENFDKVFNLENVSKDDIFSSGFVIETLEAAIWSFLVADNYEETILIAINLGGDTDTIGAIAGSIGGVYYGYNKGLFEEVRLNGMVQTYGEKFMEILG